jgi:hypothetical protein
MLRKIWNVLKSILRIFVPISLILEVMFILDSPTKKHYEILLCISSKESKSNIFVKCFQQKTCESEDLE